MPAKRGKPRARARGGDPADAAELVPIMGAALEIITDAYLETLDLQAHQRPIAELARTLARKIDSPDEFTAAAADQFRRTLALLIPADALAHRSQTNAEKIKRAPRRKAAVDDAANTKPAKPRPRARQRNDDARLQTAPLAARIRDGAARAKRR